MLQKPSKAFFNIGAVILLGIFTGIIAAFGFFPVYGVISSFFETTIIWGKIGALMVTGIFYLGIFIILFGILILTYYGEKTLAAFVNEMKNKQLLPRTFTANKKRNFYENIAESEKLFKALLYNYLDIKKEKDKLHMVCEKYLDPALAKQIHERDVNEIFLGARKKKVTVFFSDVRGFTPMTESQPPDKVVSILNDYFTEATKIITAHKGSVNKYIGDAIFAIFDEPAGYANYMEYDGALTAALEIQTRFESLQKKWAEKIDPNLNIGLGIGLAKGEVIVGNMGSDERMEFTAIGDTINFASRLCHNALAGQVLISDDIYVLVKDFVTVVKLEPVVLKGKTGIHNVYSITSRKLIIT
ncbi:MAG: adenylate/guanylate cyclase domain-containing protein [bacterium]